MLQIYVYGNNYSGFLELQAGATLDIELLTELFDEELTLGDYSLPINIPWSDRNKKILGFIEILNTLPSKEQTWWRCDIWSDGMVEMLDAKLTLLEFDGSFNYDKGTYNFSVAGTKGLFGSQVQNKTLQDLNLSKISYEISSRQFATGVMKGTISNYPYMRFAPVVIKDFFDTDLPDYNDEFLAGEKVNNIVLHDATWSFDRPSSADITVPAAAGSEEYKDHRTIPFFTYKWIIQKLFETFGYTVQGEWIMDAAWDDTVMFNNFALEKYNASNQDINNEIDPRQHLPKKLIGTFLRDLRFLFNLKYSFKNGKVISIDYRKSSLKSSDCMEATRLASRSFKATVTDYMDKGFTLTFNFDSNDGYYSDRVKEVDEKLVVASVNTYPDLNTLSIGRPIQYNEMVYITAENQFVSYSNGAGLNGWEYFSERLMPYLPPSSKGINERPGDYKFETGIAPMTTYVFYDEILEKFINMDCVAVQMKGSYYNKKYTVVYNDFDTRIFYIKNIMKSGVPIPTSFVNNRDADNNIRATKNLAWYGPDGLYDYVYKDWFNFLENTKKIKTGLLLDKLTYDQFRTKPKIRIDGTVYLPANATLQIPLKDVVTVEMYRL